MLSFEFPFINKVLPFHVEDLVWVPMLRLGVFSCVYCCLFIVRFSVIRSWIYILCVWIDGLIDHIACRNSACRVLVETTKRSFYVYNYGSGLG